MVHSRWEASLQNTKQIAFEAQLQTPADCRVLLLARAASSLANASWPLLSEAGRQTCPRSARTPVTITPACETSKRLSPHLHMKRVLFETELQPRPCSTSDDKGRASLNRPVHGRFANWSPARHHGKPVNGYRPIYIRTRLCLKRNYKPGHAAPQTTKVAHR